MTATSPERRVAGRPGNDDLEARTPMGRGLHWVEERLLDCVRGFERFALAHERETLLDGTCDQAVEHAIAELDAGRPLEARALLLFYRERDVLRDQEHHAQPAHIGVARVAVRRIGALVERSCKALRGN